MEDLKSKHQKLLEQAMDCELISRLASDFQKRELFRKLTDDLRRMAKEIEATIASRAPAPQDKPTDQPTGTEIACQCIGGAAEAELPQRSDSDPAHL